MTQTTANVEASSNSSNLSIRPTTTRMFENDFLERMSRIHPATPFVAWLPIASWFLWRTVKAELPALQILGLVATGILIWTLAEYVLHRWVFHWKSDTPFGRRVHFLLHGVHHDFPNDKDRLVMPLGASLPTSTIFYALFCLALGRVMGEAAFIGFILGYLAYDGTHYAIHHFPQKSALGRAIKKHHMLHHHADHSGGFGVSSPLWDYVFQSLPSTARARKTAAARSAKAS